MRFGRLRIAQRSASTGDGCQSLADVLTGAEVEIVGMVHGAPEPVLTRLRHLGFRQGIRVHKLRTAPLGDPAVYRLLGYDTCLRRNEAAYIRVTG